MAHNMTKEQNAKRLQRQLDFAKQQLKVHELIDILNTFDPDLPVVSDGEFVIGAVMENEFPLGDPANPYGCEFCKTVKLI